MSPRNPSMRARKTDARPNSQSPILFWQRRQWMLFIFIVIIAILMWRAIDLQVMHKAFLQSEGEARHLRTVTLSAHRGMLLDRHDEPLAISTPVDSIWVNPKQLLQNSPHQIAQLAQQLGITLDDLTETLTGRMKRNFVYIKRHIAPQQAEKILALQLKGVFSQREYRRYYPAGETTAHVLGFTDIEDRGQEGLELALDAELTGIAGSKQVLQGKGGQIIADIRSVSLPRAGQDIQVTLDRRLQYIAHRELKTAVQQHNADSGSAIILNVKTGEVLAMVNQPAHNPNDWASRDGGLYRNRAVTDVFEAGSTIKPFTIALGLESGQYTPNTLVQTHPGRIEFGEYKVRDARNYGAINLATILKKSSNVGASKIALSLPKKSMWQLFSDLGFGALSESGFPGEVKGKLAHFRYWQPVEHATLSFGYSMNVTLLQLTRAYAALGNQGRLPSVHFVADDKPRQSTPIMKPQTATQVVKMLEAVVDGGGTGANARIAGFRVAGKTGTVRKPAQNGGYADNAYFSVFVGLVPANQPELAMAILIDNPSAGSYYGGDVAAPVFSAVMGQVLRLLNIAPTEQF
ncbi:penicillin-binding protein 2 [Candidatus Albibeggiatoa sp. nov. NOAA]|uniref:peptidoglycan D,D-transpeptidase FtsI family protein n=1 Tax=Candidatus Albibeggiatoa sp. nov. NOAA TaxID=3162724 RepID=UPI00330448CB|nr:penicillin-binding protein 2 [Thiotrichaceae bacterium]